MREFILVNNTVPAQNIQDLRASAVSKFIGLEQLDCWQCAAYPSVSASLNSCRQCATRARSCAETVSRVGKHGGAHWNRFGSVTARVHSARLSAFFAQELFLSFQKGCKALCQACVHCRSSTSCALASSSVRRQFGIAAPPRGCLAGKTSSVPVLSDLSRKRGQRWPAKGPGLQAGVLLLLGARGPARNTISQAGIAAVCDAACAPSN